MPYVPKLKHLAKMLFRVRDARAAEALWLEGTWLHEQGDDEGALVAFGHARLLDRRFAGAYYNFAALTEKARGQGSEALRAWTEYLAVAEHDQRQPRDTVEKVREHVKALRGKMQN